MRGEFGMPVVRSTYPRTMAKLGKSAKGFLLGFGYDPIPEKFSQGKMIPAFLILYDQFSRPYRVPIELWANRTTKNLRPRRLCTRRKGWLLDKRDPIERH